MATTSGRITGSALECVHFKQATKAFFRAWCDPGTCALTTEIAGSKPSKIGKMRP